MRSLFGHSGRNSYLKRPTTDPMQQAVRDALIAFMAAMAQAQAEATKSAQRAGIDHSRMVKPSAYLGRKPSYDRAAFDRIKLALDSASPPSLSVIARPSACRSRRCSD
jgi:DNA invertase Pin-like site-specific DNA recombinase